MKKLVLRSSQNTSISEDATAKNGHPHFTIPYEQELNPSQLSAVCHMKGPALVLAGAGTGKTRVLVYRLARLVESGIPPEHILLLTFTRKSASEMLRRASTMLGGRCDKVHGGTFHSFAHRILRRFAPELGFNQTFSVIDQSDVEDAMNLIRNRKTINKSKRRFLRSIHLQRSMDYRSICARLWNQFYTNNILNFSKNRMQSLMCSRNM